MLRELLVAGVYCRSRLGRAGGNPHDALFEEDVLGGRARRAEGKPKLRRGGTRALGRARADCRHTRCRDRRLPPARRELRADSSCDAGARSPPQAREWTTRTFIRPAQVWMSVGPPMRLNARQDPICGRVLASRAPDRTRSAISRQNDAGARVSPLVPWRFCRILGDHAMRNIFARSSTRVLHLSSVVQVLLGIAFAVACSGNPQVPLTDDPIGPDPVAGNSGIGGATSGNGGHGSIDVSPDGDSGGSNMDSAGGEGGAEGGGVRRFSRGPERGL